MILRQVFANGIDPDQTGNSQGLHYLPSCLHYLDVVSKTTVVKFKDNHTKKFECPISFFYIFAVYKFDNFVNYITRVYRPQPPSPYAGKRLALSVLQKSFTLG